MDATRLLAIAAVISLLVAVACSSEDMMEPGQNETLRAAASQSEAMTPMSKSAPAAAIASTATSPTSVPPPTAAPLPTATAKASSPPTATAEPEEPEFKIVTLLPFDAIPAVLDPKFITAEEADAKLSDILEKRTRRNPDDALLQGGNDPDDALVLGLSINGDSRAYYVPALSQVEIVNDTVGGQPLAVTW